MSKIWNYFTLSGRIAFCKECDYKKDFPPRAPKEWKIKNGRARFNARFKSTYFDVERQEEYKNWLITEAEKVIQIQARVSDQSNSSSTKTCAVADLFNEYERDNEMENMLNTQLPSPAELNAHQKAEVEVNEYLHSKRLQITDDPFKYWSGENSIKWPLLTKLSHRYFSAPATSSESERLFSTAGLVVSNLRTRLLPDNVEKLLFLHNNLKIYDYKYYL
uniref:HAT C-terminal dimerisation domain-containing protein n=1 Tax=Meloidogyne incognita TaxID=6306 RepID=A0A914N323_MELIC